MVFWIPIVAIIAWAIVEATKHRARAGLSGEAEQVLRALGDQLDEAHAERLRLQQRIENLEAIVTSEAYELEREARRAISAPPGRELSEGGGLPPLAIEEHDTPEDDEARAASVARRVRGG